MLNIYMVRHGKSEGNEKGVYYGQLDYDLTTEGKKGIQKLKPSLKDINFESIYVSPLKRATQTADILLDDKIDYTLESRIIELDFGLWEGQSYQQIQEMYNERWEKWCADWMNTAPNQGEPFIQMYYRVSEFIKDILDKNKGNKNVLIISHQGCLRVMLTCLLHMEPSGFWHFNFMNGYYSKIQVDEYGHSTILKMNALL